MQTRLASLDRLKAILITFVVIWHARPWLLTGSSFFPARALLGFFYFYITTLGVPTFILVSLYLYYQHVGPGTGYFYRRISRLAIVYAFWVGVQWIISYISTYKLAMPSLSTLLDGGPGIPGVGGSVFYYLADLIILTALAEVYAKLSRRCAAYVGGVLACWVVAYIVFINFHYVQNTGYLEVFIIYVPAAFYMKEFVRLKYVFLILWLVFSIVEAMLILKYGVKVDPYCRLSNVTGAMALMGVALSSRNVSNKLSTVLSRYSLGIFAVHKYALKAGYGVMAVTGLSLQNEMTQNQQRLILFIWTVVVTAALVYCLGRTILARFIR